MSSRRGYVLLAVLWFLTGGVALATLAMSSARSGLATASNRAALLRAEWQAEECIARARAAMLNEVLGESTTTQESFVRQGLGFRARVLSSPLVHDCPGSVDLDPFGFGLSLATVQGPLLARVLRASGIPAPSTDSLVDAFLDWRDPDDSTRAHGAERDWYASRGKRSPRNSELLSVDEMLAVRGFEEWFGPGGAVDPMRLFTTDADRLFVDAASDAILASLPGFADEAAALVSERRRENADPLPELLALMGGLSPESQATMTRAFGELGDLVTVAPGGWILRARSSGVPGSPHAERLQVEIELRLAIDGRRHAVTQRRISP